MKAVVNAVSSWGSSARGARSWAWISRAGEFRAVIDRAVPFADIVDAYRYVETAEKTGIVVINVVPPREK